MYMNVVHIYSINVYWNRTNSRVINIVEEQSIGPVTLSWEQRFDG